MGAFIEMTNLVGNLTTVATEFNYPESTKCILSGDENRLRIEFPQTYSNLMSCNHHRDNRSPIEYGRDLVASWLFEDYLINELTKVGLSIIGAGADKNREVLPNTKVSSSSDCIVSYNGKRRGLEIMNDYTGWWKKTNKIDLRDQKYNKIDRTNSIFLGISNSDNTYILINKISDYPSKFIPAHGPYGFKPAYRVTITDADLKPLDFETIANQIKTLL
jgi:hypothetical protein